MKVYSSLIMATLYVVYGGSETDMDDLKAKGVEAFLWDLFGKMARHGTSFIVTIFLARLLDPSAFGLIAMIMVIVMV